MGPIIPVKIYFDGAMLRNTGGDQPIGAGVYVTIAGKPAPQYCKAVPTGVGSNSVSEWVAFVYAMHTAYKIVKHFHASGKPAPFITIYGDNQSVIYTWNGRYKLSEKFKFYHDKAKQWYDKISPNINAVLWVAREYNTEADKLSKQAIAHLHKEKQ